jgi:predicted acetyltransferase
LRAVSLVAPDGRFERSYRTLVEEFKAHGERLVPFTLSFSYEKFHDLVATLHQHARGVGVPDGFVPNSPTGW